MHSAPLDWAALSDAQQLSISQAALHFAAHAIAHQAELLAGEIEAGTLPDCGGPDALRLLAAILRLSGPQAQSSGPATCDLATMGVAGRA